MYSAPARSDALYQREFYQRIVERRTARRVAARLRSALAVLRSPAAVGAVLLIAACATTPPSLGRASLSAMPADVDVAVAARVAALRAPLATVVEEAEVPVPAWLLERAVVVVAGVYVRTEPGYLIWMQGVDLNPGLSARLLISPEWFFVAEPYPHYRSVDAAVLLPGRDVLLITNLPLDRVQRAFDAEAFALPADATIDEAGADLLVAVPDLAGTIVELAADSRLGLLADAFPAKNVWLTGTAVSDGIVVSGALRTEDRNLARLLAALAGKILTFQDVRLQADGAWVRLSGLMRYDELIDGARVMLDPERLDPRVPVEAGP